MKSKIAINEIFVKRLDFLMAQETIFKKLVDKSRFLAELCDVSNQAARKWLSGESLPEISKLLIISERFSTTASYLLGEIDVRSLKDDEGYKVSSKNLIKKGSIKVEISETLFSDLLVAGDVVICRPVDSIISNGAIYLFQSANNKFFRRLTLLDNGELIIVHEVNGDEVSETFSDKKMIDLFLSSLVGKVEAVIRSFNEDNNDNKKNN